MKMTLDAKIEIIPVEYGKSFLPDCMVFFNGAKDQLHSIVFMIYLIKLQERLILVDAGCETMPGFHMREFVGSVKALENIGILPENVTDVIITHAHHDHIECVKYFRNAVIYIQRDEYENGNGYFTPDLKVQTFENELQITDYIKAIRIGGHSKGSSIVEIKDKDKKYVIVGDECYLRECIDKKISTGASCCPEKSLEFIEKYSDRKYTILLCHDK